MKIVVLDGYTMNPGDLDWQELRALGVDCEIYERSSQAEVPLRAADGARRWQSPPAADWWRSPAAASALMRGAPGEQAQP